MGIVTLVGCFACTVALLIQPAEERGLVLPLATSACGLLGAWLIAWGRPARWVIPSAVVLLGGAATAFSLTWVVAGWPTAGCGLGALGAWSYHRRHRALVALRAAGLVDQRPWRTGHPDGVWQLLPLPNVTEVRECEPTSFGEILATLAKNAGGEATGPARRGVARGGGCRPASAQAHLFASEQAWVSRFLVTPLAERDLEEVVTGGLIPPDSGGLVPGGPVVDSPRDVRLLPGGPWV